MKILVVGDVHWSIYSSIVRKRGEIYSSRLENLIKSMNWVEKVAQDQKCSMVIGLGDFFDRSDLNAEEITALQDIKWAEDIQHFFIIGNHESNVASLQFNSTKALQKCFFQIIDKPKRLKLDSKLSFYFLPYILEQDRKQLKEYLNELTTEYPTEKNVIFSHNDIKGIRYGMFESKEGFDLKEIEENCNLFINGHLHNGNFLNDKETILNLGNLTGQNFTEDAFNYSHMICILDTDTLELSFFENPYAFNFYKLDINKESDLNKLNNLKDNAVISIKCNEKYVDNLKQILDANSKIIESKTVIFREESSEITVNTVELGSNDYLKQFTEFTLEKLGSNEVVLYELGEVCK